MGLSSRICTGVEPFYVVPTQDMLSEVQVPEDEDGLRGESEPVGAVVLLALELPVLIEEGLRDALPPQEHLRDRVVANPEVHLAGRLHAQLGPGTKSSCYILQSVERILIV